VHMDTTRTVDRIAVFPASGVPTNTMLSARDRDLRRSKYSATVAASLSKLSTGESV
jgi:hypothetical protein